MITDGKIASPTAPSFAAKAWTSFKNYFGNVMGCYIELAVPFVMLVTFSAALSTHCDDRERIGLMWMRYATVEDDVSRERQFPVYPPGSEEYRKRMRLLEGASGNNAVVA